MHLWCKMFEPLEMDVITNQISHDLHNNFYFDTTLTLIPFYKLKPFWDVSRCYIFVYLNEMNSRSLNPNLTFPKFYNQ